MKTLILCLLSLTSISAMAGDRGICESNPDAPMCVGSGSTPMAPPALSNAEQIAAQALQRYAAAHRDAIVGQSCAWIVPGVSLTCRFETAAGHDCSLVVKSRTSISCRR